MSQVIYQNTRAVRVRFLQALAWTAVAGFIALAFWGAAAGPDPRSWETGAILAPLFALMALGMEWYLRRYVTALASSPSGLEVETLSSFGRKRFLAPWRDVTIDAIRHDIGTAAEVPSVNNTAVILRVRGKSYLIVDTTVDQVDPAALQRLTR